MSSLNSLNLRHHWPVHYPIASENLLSGGAGERPIQHHRLNRVGHASLTEGLVSQFGAQACKPASVSHCERSQAAYRLFRHDLVGPLRQSMLHFAQSGGLAYAGSQQGGRLTGPYDRGPAADMDLFLYKTVEVDCLVANSRTGGIRCQVMSS